ncbi:MAG: transcriptional repressor [Blastocatellia bacterium]|nr:transcriptional repressor [Blastocatellia bacterium]
MNHRNTKQRRTILDTVECHGGHLTADEIHRLARRRHPHLSLGTVYRNLRVLAAQGALRELDFGLAVAYFEAAKEPHYHLICRVCERIVDVELPLESRLLKLVKRAPGVGGFQIEGHRLDFIGVCEACRDSGRPAKKRTRTDR